MNCNSCRVRGQKSKLSYRHAKLRAVKEKEIWECLVLLTVLFIFFALREGKERLIPHFFIFTETVETKLYLVTECHDSKMQ